MIQRGHHRMVGGVIRCPRTQRQHFLGDDHHYGQEFVCPGCGVRIDATDFFKRNPPRRSVQITVDRAALSEGGD